MPCLKMFQTHHLFLMLLVYPICPKGTSLGINIVPMPIRFPLIMLTASFRLIAIASTIAQSFEAGTLNSPQFDREEMMREIAAATQIILEDQRVTRKGKDKGAVRRGLEALLVYLSNPSNTR